ncbi:MAG: uncharacterized protein JWN73_1406 [Betaproteobacteria bacterium]|nr:uncharacterized protein [Betaproteobacteria bacterium]
MKSKVKDKSKSNRQRSIDAAAHRAALEAAAQRRVRVNPALLGPNHSYGTPDFVVRGHYLDFPFACKDCGKQEVWSAHQQKWWYQSARGDLWTVAVRCRPCRRREQARVAQARAVQQSGSRAKNAK